MEIENLLMQILKEIETPEIREVAGDINQMKGDVATIKVVEVINAVAEYNSYSFCVKDGIIYCFNGMYWIKVQENVIKWFISYAVNVLGGNGAGRRHHKWKEDVYRQFMSEALFIPKERTEGQTLINLLNGTFEITAEHQILRKYRATDFLRHILDFNYDQQATAPMFHTFLDRVLPDRDCQTVLGEYMGYIFSKGLKLEKVLLLTGTGANGKSTFFNIVTEVFGRENVSSFSLQELTQGSYQRAELQDVLVNFCSEISGKMETSVFKQLASNEPVSARSIYGRPFTMTEYGKMVFLCNELPWQIEQTDAFFRRFIIIPFEQTIPEKERDPDLAKKIIKSELSGVFNWMLDGLKRILQNKRFTESEIIRQQIEQFRYERDTVAVFLDQKQYEPTHQKVDSLANFYEQYKGFCQRNGLLPVSNITFSRRLRQLRYHIVRNASGNVVYYGKKEFVRPQDEIPEEETVSSCNNKIIPRTAPNKRTIPNKVRNETSNDIHKEE